MQAYEAKKLTGKRNSAIRWLHADATISIRQGRNKASTNSWLGSGIHCGKNCFLKSQSWSCVWQRTPPTCTAHHVDEHAKHKKGSFYTEINKNEKVIWKEWKSSKNEKAGKKESKKEEKLRPIIIESATVRCPTSSIRKNVQSEPKLVASFTVGKHDVFVWRGSGTDTIVHIWVGEEHCDLTMPQISFQIIVCLLLLLQVTMGDFKRAGNRNHPALYYFSFSSLPKIPFPCASEVNTRVFVLSGVKCFWRFTCRFFLSNLDLIQDTPLFAMKRAVTVDSLPRCYWSIVLFL